MTCTIQGCTKAARQRGWCPMHYERWRTKGHPEVQRARKGCVDAGGYIVRRLTYNHPLADRTGRTYEHRVVLFACIGDGVHACHWCLKPVSWSDRTLHVDHLDDDRTNNNPSNLVPSCLGCNSGRANAGRARRDHAGGGQTPPNSGREGAVRRETRYTPSTQGREGGAET